jgi:hypothetical protein
MTRHTSANSKWRVRHRSFRIGSRDMPNTLLTALSAMLISTATAGDAPISVDLEYSELHIRGHFQHDEPGDGMITVTSNVDNVTISDLKVNQGNCVAYISNPPRTGRQNGRNTVELKLGEVLVLFFRNCKIEDVTISTDSGNWTFQWGRPGKPGWH